MLPLARRIKLAGLEFDSSLLALSVCAILASLEQRSMNQQCHNSTFDDSLAHEEVEEEGPSTMKMG